MTVVRLSVKEARQLGLVFGEPSAPARPRRRSGTYNLRCHACGETMRSEAAQTRHRHATGHRRYEMPLGGDER